MTLLNSPSIPTELLVVGEDRDDPRHLLLLGDDGLYYSWSLLDDAAEPVEPDQRWRLTTPPPEELRIHQS
jgi:hypothetical protein